jgi:hypothetical protein
MTFDELAYGISFGVPFCIALAEGRKAGLLGVLIGLIIGVGFGVGNFLITRATFQWVRRHPDLGERNPNWFWTMVSWILCVLLFICIAGIGLLGRFIAKLILH